MSHPTGSATAEPHGNVGIIVQFLRGKGLPDAAIAAILGNFQVESSFNPSAYNSGEGAIGLGQWEGGRRTNLQQWASAHGGSETDLQMQLGYMWHELSTGYSGVLDQLKHATDPGSAAAIWDAQYEVSSGDARQTRVNNAVTFFNNNLQPGGVDSSNAGGGPATPGGSSGGGGGSKDGHPNYSKVDGLGKLLNQVPALRHLVDEAVANDWSSSTFLNQVEDSDWWKNHSVTARSVLIQQANDPASYDQTLTNTRQFIATMSRQLGMSLDGHQLDAIATSAMLSGNTNNSQWITQQISRREDYSSVTDLGGLQGGMAATSQQLQQLAGDYGFKWSPQQIAQHAQDVLDGTTTMDTYRQRLQTWAASAFPSLAQQIQGGATVKDLADPYVQSMSQLLEIDPGTLDVYNPKIRQALQGTAGKDGQLAATPLWQFEKQVRQDPRWARTQNAMDTMSSALVNIGATFGFGPGG